MPNKKRRKKTTEPSKRKGAPPRQGATAEPESALDTTYVWSADTISQWLYSSLAEWLAPSHGRARANAFFPLLLSDEQEIGTQIENAAKQSAWLRTYLSDGIALALQIWRPFRGLDTLEELFDLASYVGAPRLVWHSTRMLRSAAIYESHPDVRDRLVSAITTAVTTTPWDDESEAFVEELRLRNLWKPHLEARVLFARLRSHPDSWILLAATALPGLYHDTKGRPKRRALLLTRLVEIVTVERVMDGLSSQQMTKYQDALILLLFFDDEPILRVTHESGVSLPNRTPPVSGIEFRSRRYSRPETNTPQEWGFVKFINHVFRVGAFIDAQAQIQDGVELTARVALAMLAAPDKDHMIALLPDKTTESSADAAASNNGSAGLPLLPYFQSQMSLKTLNDLIEAKTATQKE